MADRLRGITVEIGGDTTKLSASLKQVNTEIRSTQSQLKDVNKLLKLDPGNSTLAAQQYRLLGDAIKETKEKLQALKEAEKQAKTALEKGEIEVSAVVSVLIKTMEEYANYGFAFMAEKLKEDPGYFFSHRAFLDIFLQLTDKPRGDAVSDEEPEEL